MGLTKRDEEATDRGFRAQFIDEALECLVHDRVRVLLTSSEQIFIKSAQMNWVSNRHLSRYEYNNLMMIKNRIDPYLRNLKTMED